MGNGKATIGRRWRTDRMSQRCSNLEVTMEYNPCSCGHITNTCWDTYFTYWDSGREVLNAQNEMLGELWSPSRLPLSMMAGPFCGTTKTLVGRQLEFSEWQWFFADTPSTGWLGYEGWLWRDAKWWLPKYRTKVALWDRVREESEEKKRWEG